MNNRSDSSGSSSFRDGPWLPTVADGSAVVGAGAWLSLVASEVLGPIREFIALAILVLVPLALRLADTPARTGRRSRWYWAAVIGQPVMAVPAIYSLTLSPGPQAVLAAVPWTAATVAIAGFGGWRLTVRGCWPLEELAVDAGLLYIIVGGGALLFDRAGVTLWFQPILITLTIIHFHYAGAVLPILAGLAGRCRPEGRVGRVLAGTTAIIVVGPAIIAVGITAAALSLPFAGVIEFVAVGFFTAAVGTFAIVVVGRVVPRLERRSQQLLIGVASLAVPGSMAMAVVYALARATGGVYFGIGAGSFGLMVTYHGRVNALAFAVPALVGWRLGVPTSGARPPGIPVSGITAGRRVGADFLARRGLSADTEATGMIDRLGAYARDGFDPDGVESAVARFYEESGAYELAVDPDWARPWGFLARWYRPLVTRIGQLSVPLVTVDSDAVLDGRVAGVEGDGAELGDRAWIRSNADRTTGAARMTYVGVYDRYEGIGGPFLRVAFPLPGANLTGILRPEHGGADGDGLVLSSFPTSRNADDAGLYLLLGGHPIRLPLNERLLVEGTAESLRATHRVELLGIRVFTLRYRIRRAAE